MAERFETHLGENYNPKYVAVLSDEELVEKINEQDMWDGDLLRDLCWRADMLDEFLESDDFESVIYKAAEVLGVKLN